MKIACLTFTRKGQQIAARIQSGFDGEVALFTKHNYKQHLSGIFEESDRIIFISSTGIAVRLSAPYLKDKTRDPAIVVVDDLGRYAISLISGHLGGANDLANKVADILNCQPVITTASDGRGIEAVDLFAKRYNLMIEDLKDVKILTAMMVDERSIMVVSEIETALNYHHLVQEQPEGYIYVTSQEQIRCDVPFCVLRLKNLNIGIGCRKGKTQEEIVNAIKHVFQTHNLSLKSIRSLATAAAKKDEPGILKTCELLGAKLHIFSNDDIHAVQDQFAASPFVQSTIGVTAVCEPCAYLAGGEIIIPKTAMNGITIAVARKK